MVDVVVLWVDGGDPLHEAKRRKYMDQSIFNAQQNSATRFASVGEEYYCLHLIRKNMPWVDKVFLLTDNQEPSWLTSAKKSELNVTVVDHKTIFGTDQNFLPTFNSQSIETLVYRIPGLSEKFILFNDDFFVIKRTIEKDYFEGDVPKMRGYLIPGNKRLARIYLSIPGVREKIYGVVAPRFGSEKIREAALRIALISHVPFPVNLKDYKSCMESNARGEGNAKYRFRDSKQFSPIQVYTNIFYQKNRIIVVPADLAYCQNPEFSEIMTVQDINKEINKRNAKHLCLQSLDQYDQKSLESIKMFLDQALTDVN